MSLEYIGKIENINGTYNFKKTEKDIEANVLTKVALIGYDKYNFKNFNLDINYSGKQVKIKDFSNNLISLKGDYNIESQKVNANLFVDRVTNNDVALDKVEFILENLKANVEGAKALYTAQSMAAVCNSVLSPREANSKKGKNKTRARTKSTKAQLRRLKGRPLY